MFRLFNRQLSIRGFMTKARSSRWEQPSRERHEGGDVVIARRVVDTNGLVGTRALPILSSSDLGLTITACLMHCKGKATRNVRRWTRKKFCCVFEARKRDEGLVPLGRRCKRSFHASAEHVVGDLLGHDFPTGVDFPVTKLPLDHFAVVGQELLHACWRGVLGVLSDAPSEARAKRTEKRKPVLELVEDFHLPNRSASRGA